MPQRARANRPTRRSAPRITECPSGVLALAAIGPKSAEVVAKHFSQDRAFNLFGKLEEEELHKLAEAFAITKGCGLVLSDRSGESQAFYHDGDLSSEPHLRQPRALRPPVNPALTRCLRSAGGRNGTGTSRMRFRS